MAREEGSGTEVLDPVVKSTTTVPIAGRPARLMKTVDPLEVTSEDVNPEIVLVPKVKPFNGLPLANVRPENSNPLKAPLPKVALPMYASVIELVPTVIDSVPPPN